MGPKKKGKGGSGSPTQGEEAKSGEKISEVWHKHILFFSFIFFRVLRLTKSGLVFRSRALRRNLTGGMRNSGILSVMSFGHTKLALSTLSLRRFEERNNELETQFIQLREDKADVVAFLKRTLQQRTDTIHVSDINRIDKEVKRHLESWQLV